MIFRIRELQEFEYPLLNDFLYEAIFQKEGAPLAPASIIKNPELQVYINGFGTMKDDYCLCAEYQGKVIGAVWVRNIEGYGNVDNDTPEFAISVYKEFRGRGIGSELMKQMLALLKEKGYRKASLAVQKDNYALGMYQKAGFKIVDENDEEFIMEYLF